jgi:flavin reductase (DIM6/NTAB) family NADH-FMN oxidoreductase RutF
MQRITDQPWSPFGQYAHPARAARGRERTRWLWCVPLALGLLAAGGWILSHDPAGGLALSPRGWITVAAAAAVAIALATHRRAGRLLRTIAEFAVVATLAVLLATASPDHAAGPRAHDPNACPSVVQARAWLECIGHQAAAAAKSNHHP